MKAFVLVLLVLLASCTPTKRLTRLLEKHPDLLKTEIKTTYDTVIVPGQRIDTFFSFTNGAVDTFYIYNTNTRIIKYANGLQVDQQTAPDTIINKTVYVDRILEKEKRSNKDLIILMCLVLILIMGLVLFKKI